MRQTLHFKLASDVKTQVSRRSAMDDLLKHNKNETVTSSRIRVTFKNEIGEDHRGLTQDLFSAFWELLTNSLTGMLSKHLLYHHQIYKV